MGAPDLAAGDLFGSSMANMLILAVINLLPAGSQLFRRATLDHVLSAALAIVLTAVAAVLVLLRPERTVLGVGPGSLVLLLVYLAGSRILFRQSAVARRATATVELSEVPDETDRSTRRDGSTRSLRRALLAFVVASAVIVIAAPLFARAAARLADATGIGNAFIGTWLVGLATSLPELVTSFAAVRLGAYDLAVGNLFGSNAFNMTILVALDVAEPSSLFATLAPVHAVSALAAIALMAVATAALIQRTEGRLRLLEPSSAVIIGGYVAGLAAVLLAGR